MKLSTLFLLCTGAAGVVFGDVPDCLVEYIESTNTASYVDTGIAPNPRKTRMVVKLAPMVVDNNQVAFFGSGNSWGNNVCNFVLLNSGMFRLDWIGAQTKVFTPNVGQAYLFDCRNNVVSIDGQQWSNGNATMKTDADYPERPILLFNAMNDKGKVGGAMMRLYECRIYQDGVALDANYIPCVKDGVVGLYNTVDETIVYDSGNKGFAASEVERTADYRISGGEVQTTLKLTKPSVGGTCAEPEERWATMNGKVTLAATPDAGMKAAWTVSDIDGKLTSYFGDTVEITMPPCPSTASLSFYPEESLTTVEALKGALVAAQAGAVIHLAPTVFELEETLVLDKEITLQGAGRDATVLTAKSGFTVEHGISMTANATVRGLKVTGFATSEKYVNGIGVNMTAGTLDDVSICKNKNAGHNLGNGTGVYMTGGVVTNSLIEGNWVESTYGGTKGIGVYMTGGTVVDSTIRGNWRNRNEHYGAGVAVCGDNAKLIRCLVEGNTSTGMGNNTGNTRGLGVYMDKNGLVDSCRIVSNDVHGVYMSNGTMKNSLVVGHRTTSTSYSAGVDLSGSARMVNCTVWNNAAPNGMAGLKMTAGTAVNNIFWQNGTMGNVTVSGGTFNTNIYDSASVVSTSKAVGNVTADPHMKDPANGDFTLTFVSPVLDAAQPLDDVTEDLVGTARPQGAGSDVGAFESLMSGGDLQCTIIVPVADWRFDQTPSVMSRVAGGTGTYTYSWYLDGDLIVGETSPEPSFPELPLGRHTLKLVVSDGETTVEHEMPDALRKRPTTVYVAENGGDVYPYDTEDKAARSVNDAFDAVWREAGMTSTINIGEGDYDLTGGFTLITPCQFVGAGRDLTRLHGGKTGGVRAFVIENADTLIKDLTVMECVIAEYGPAVKMSVGTLDNVRLCQNGTLSMSTPRGGALYMSGGTVTNCLIDANVPVSSYEHTWGGGVYMSGGELVDCVVCSNRIARNQQRGTGVCIVGGTMRNCRVFGNMQKKDNGTFEEDQIRGGGVCMCADGNTVSSMLVENCLIYSNGCSGVYLDTSYATMKNCLVFGHRRTGSLSSGNVNYCGARVTNGKLYNCTIFDNVAVNDADGYTGLHQTGGAVANCIVWGNAPENSSKGSCYLTCDGFNNNVIDVAVTKGTANVVGDPKFRDAANGDFHLKFGSAAIGKGMPLEEVITDIEGSVRDQEAMDAGCYMYVASAEELICKVDVATDFGLGDSPVVGAVVEGGELDGLTFEWFVNGEKTREGVGEKTLTLDRPALGKYLVTLRVSQGERSASDEEGVLVEIHPLKTFVSADGSDTYPYDTAEKAAHSVNEAFDVLWKNSSVTTALEIAAGTYPVLRSVSIATPIVVTGAGRDATVLTGGECAGRCFALSHADATVSGLTVTGFTNILQGVGVSVASGRLADVRICNCCQISETAGGGIQGGCGLRVSGGTVVRCLIDGNCPAQFGEVSYNYGRCNGVGVLMSGGELVDCTIVSNRTWRHECYGVGVNMSKGVLRRCEIGWNLSDASRNPTAGASDRDEFGEGVCGDGTIDSCSIHDNGGSGVYSSGEYNGKITMTNTLVCGHHNFFRPTSGVSLSGGEIVNCTFAGNTSACEGGTDLAMTSGTLVNSIAVSADVADTVEKRNNCLNEAVSFKPDYRLRSSAANCIDKGDNSVWDGIAEPTDLRGNPRIDRINKIVDLGCFEWLPVGFKLFVR